MEKLISKLITYKDLHICVYDLGAFSKLYAISFTCIHLNVVFR